MSKTLSLANIPSTHFKTPTQIIYFSFLTMIAVFTFPFLVAWVESGIIPPILIVSITMQYNRYLIDKYHYQVSKSDVKKRIHENDIDIGKTAIKWKGGLIMKIDVGINVSDLFYLIFCAQVSKDLLNNPIQLDDRIWMLLWVMLIFLQFFIRLMSILQVG